MQLLEIADGALVFIYNIKRMLSIMDVEGSDKTLLNDKKRNKKGNKLLIYKYSDDADLQITNKMEIVALPSTMPFK